MYVYTENTFRCRGSEYVEKHTYNMKLLLFVHYLDPEFGSETPRFREQESNITNLPKYKVNIVYQNL